MKTENPNQNFWKDWWNNRSRGSSTIVAAARPDSHTAEITSRYLTTLIKNMLQSSELSIKESKIKPDSTLKKNHHDEKCISEYSTILDLGSGPGELIHQISRRLSLQNVTFRNTILMDISEESLILCPVSHYSRICASFVEIPLLDESVDLIISYSALQYQKRDKDFEIALKELFRIMKPSSILIMSGIPDYERKEFFLQGYQKTNLSKAEISGKVKIANKCAWFEADQFCRKVINAGFSDVRSSKMDPAIPESQYMFTVTARKT